MQLRKRKTATEEELCVAATPPEQQQRRRRGERPEAAGAAPRSLGAELDAAAAAAPSGSPSAQVPAPVADAAEPGALPMRPPPAVPLAPALAGVLATLDDLRAAIAHLRASDPSLAPLIERSGLPERLLLKDPAGSFHALARAIVYQQLSTKAADTIMGRVLAACGGGGGAGGGGGLLTAAGVLAAEEAALRAAGLSGSKASYLRGVADHFHSGRVCPASLAALPDDAVVAELTRMKGIGEWSAHMHLMFHQGRPDVLPVGDLGVRRGAAAHYGLAALPGPAELAALAERWRPYRSVGSWLMWRAAEAAPPARRAGRGGGSGGGGGGKANKAAG